MIDCEIDEMCVTQDRLKIVGVKEWGEKMQGEGPMRDRMSRRGRVIAPINIQTTETHGHFTCRGPRIEKVSSVVENHTRAAIIFNQSDQVKSSQAFHPNCLFFLKMN